MTVHHGQSTEHDRWCVVCPGFAFADATLTCRECGTGFLFTVAQQRYWFLDLELIEAAKPPRLCPDCGRHRRTVRAARNRLTEATIAARHHPDDPVTLLALAAATASAVAHTGTGDAAAGVAAARRARVIEPKTIEGWYWEAACHDAAGRPTRAVDCYRRFITEASTTRRLRKLVGHAAHRAHELRRSASTEPAPAIRDGADAPRHAPDPDRSASG